MLSSLVVGLIMLSACNSFSAQPPKEYSKHSIVQEAENLQGKRVYFEGNWYTVTEDIPEREWNDAFSRWLTLKRPRYCGTKTQEVNVASGLRSNDNETLGRKTNNTSFHEYKGTREGGHNAHMRSRTYISTWVKALGVALGVGAFCLLNKPKSSNPAV